MKSKRTQLFAALSLALLATGIAGPANAAPVPTPVAPGTTVTHVLSSACVAQLHVASPTADTSACEVTITSTSSAASIASPSQVSASVAGQPAAIVNQVQPAVENGIIYYVDWSQTYQSGLTWEIQKGRIFWDGTYAWQATHRGNTGTHTCHAPGSVAVGIVISNIHCNDPGAATVATSTEIFDLSFIVQGSPVSGVCEMLSHYTKTGVHTAGLSGFC
jgi:hypothetical protein